MRTGSCNRVPTCIGGRPLISPDFLRTSFVIAGRSSGRRRCVDLAGRTQPQDHPARDRTGAALADTFAARQIAAGSERAQQDVSEVAAVAEESSAATERRARRIHTGAGLPALPSSTCRALSLTHCSAAGSPCWKKHQRADHWYSRTWMQSTTIAILRLRLRASVRIRSIWWLLPSTSATQAR